MRQSAIFNYIPPRSKNFKNFDSWYSYYKNDLIYIFEIIKNNLHTKYSPDIKCDNKLFTKFCYFVFNTSTRNIPKDIIDV